VGVVVHHWICDIRPTFPAALHHQPLAVQHRRLSYFVLFRAVFTAERIRVQRLKTTNRRETLIAVATTTQVSRINHQQCDALIIFLRRYPICVRALDRINNSDASHNWSIANLQVRVSRHKLIAIYWWRDLCNCMMIKISYITY